MSKTRNYRPSQLHTSSAITEPAQAAPPAPQTPEGSPEVSHQGAGQAEKTSERRTEPKKSKPKRERRVYYMDQDQHARAEAAYAFTAGHTRLRSWTAFVEAAIEEKTRALEAKYNDSKPFTELDD